MTEAETFTIEQALAGQRALREELRLDEERFPLSAFIGMVSDEIEQMRAAGRDDAAIAALLTQANGASVTAAAIARYYAPPEARQRGS